MEKVFMVIISVDYYNARKVCENIQSVTFENRETLNSLLIKELGSLDNVGVCSLNDFMDAVNDQELDNLSESFISYVTIKS